MARRGENEGVALVLQHRRVPVHGTGDAPHSKEVGRTRLEEERAVAEQVVRLVRARVRARARVRVRVRVRFRIRVRVRLS